MLRGRELSVATRQPPYYLPRVQSRQVQKGETLPYRIRHVMKNRTFISKKSKTLLTDVYWRVVCSSKSTHPCGTCDKIWTCDILCMKQIFLPSELRRYVRPSAGALHEKWKEVKMNNFNLLRIRACWEIKTTVQVSHLRFAHGITYGCSSFELTVGIGSRSRNSTCRA